MSKALESASAPDPSDFTTKIDNPFMTLRAGTTFVYDDKGLASHDVMTVTNDTEANGWVNPPYRKGWSL